MIYTIGFVLLILVLMVVYAFNHRDNPRIFLYHNVSDKEVSYKTNMSSAKFERQIAMTQSMLVHSKAQMAVHQANSCTIGANAVCATCGRNISLDSRCFTPPGRPNELYHQQCKPGR